ncbi:hypothetical protein NMD96_12835 [Edwardsiella tarda]|uniref:hypothetical protein n=1 Tax=Edwardsiella tarda TaxID=636 RepID=UPI00351C2CDA
MVTNNNAQVQRWINQQAQTIPADFQRELSRRCRTITQKLQDKINSTVKDGAVNFTQRAMLFNYIDHGFSRTNQIILRGNQAKYLKNVLGVNGSNVSKWIPTLNANLTSQGNIKSLKSKIKNNKYKQILSKNGKKYLIDVSSKNPKKHKVIAYYGAVSRHQLFDFYQEAENLARQELANMRGTFGFRRN